MKRFLMMVVAVMMTTSLFAQHSVEQQKREETWRQIESWKIAFFTHELCITPDEALNFWPIYNDMNSQLKKLDWQKRQLRKSINDANNVEYKDADYYETLQKIMDIDKRRLDVRHEAYNKIAKIMPVAKLLKIEDVEERFRQKLFDYLRKKSTPHHPQK